MQGVFSFHGLQQPCPCSKSYFRMLVLKRGLLDGFVLQDKSETAAVLEARAKRFAEPISGAAMSEDAKRAARAARFAVPAS